MDETLHEEMFEYGHVYCSERHFEETIVRDAIELGFDAEAGNVDDLYDFIENNADQFTDCWPVDVDTFMNSIDKTVLDHELLYAK